MPRYYRKSVKSRSYSKSNWSHENKGCQATFSDEQINGLYQAGSNIVPAITTQGVRTVGNFTVTIPANYTGTSNNDCYWALVYVPQGEQAKYLFATGGLDGSLYEPNQYVLASGFNDTTAGPIRIHSRMLRKLHSGDFISLIIGTTNPAAGINVRALVSYSIKYN